LVAVAGLLWFGSAGSAGAATLPGPLADTLTSVTDPATATVTQLLGGNATPVPSAPALPAAPTLPSPPALPAVPGLPGGGSGDGAQDDSGVSARADAPAGDDLAAVDAAVAEFLGVCARVPQSVLPVRADIVVLDRNVIAELVDAGVPLQPLVVPCPESAPAPGTPPHSTVPGAPRAAPQDPAGPRSGLPTSLAFTGIEIAPTLLLAGGLIALGTAFLRRAHLLAAVR
jgi:hypothetical protein